MVHILAMSNTDLRDSQVTRVSAGLQEELLIVVLLCPQKAFALALLLCVLQHSMLVQKLSAQVLWNGSVRQLLQDLP